MHVWAHDRFTFPLPPGHRFPLPKYGLLRERLVADGLAQASEVHEPQPVAWEDLRRVHDGALLRRIRTGTLALREQRGLGLPWSPALVERGRRATAARSWPRATRSRWAWP